ncbi:MAG: hypothetical protein HIU91_10135 [Acidobacteria bacterium]|nr:hypothetical protein [Acidobacteriota bacterium]
MSQDSIKLERLLEWVANEMYIARKDKEASDGEALKEWESSRKRIERKIEGLREGL